MKYADFSKSTKEAQSCSFCKLTRQLPDQLIYHLMSLMKILNVFPQQHGNVLGCQVRL